MSQVMEDLRKGGYPCDFHMRGDEFVCADTDKAYQPNELVIVNTYRFEGESDPGDMTILYAIEAEDGSKGLCLDAYGSDSTPELDEFIKNVKIVEREV
ncbi:MAG: phosphoribosylpyrophosphate synthetase [Ferruginibacter sp.]|nr:phosphoribosylpyrophosphate synthetase [Cytophagales bacterium]